MANKKPKKKSVLEQVAETYYAAAREGYLGKKAQVSAKAKSMKSNKGS